MNAKLIDSLVQIILSLSPEERLLLEKQLFLDTSEPSSQELMQLAQSSGSFNFLYDEPDMYNLKDGEPV